MIISHDGLVGIGPAYPTKKLYVNGSGFDGGGATFESTSSGNGVIIKGVNGAGINDTAYLAFLSNNSSHDSFIGLTGDVHGAGHLRFIVANGERVRIKSNGAVGIGVTDPQHTLHVNGTIHGSHIGLAHGYIGTSFSNAFQIREAGLLSNTNTSDAYRPRLGFHWGSVVASSISLRTDGAFSFDDNPGTGLTSIYAANVYANLVGSATTLSTTRDNWSTNGTISNVVGQLAWKTYGNGHTIFDASQGTAPNGAAISNTNPGNSWSGSYPTLMGWNGSQTYGVRVDSARVSDAVVGSEPAPLYIVRASAGGGTNYDYITANYSGIVNGQSSWSGTRYGNTYSLRYSGSRWEIYENNTLFSYKNYTGDVPWPNFSTDGWGSGWVQMQPFGPDVVAYVDMYLFRDNWSNTLSNERGHNPKYAKEDHVHNVLEFNRYNTYGFSIDDSFNVDGGMYNPFADTITRDNIIRPNISGARFTGKNTFTLSTAFANNTTSQTETFIDFCYNNGNKYTTPQNVNANVFNGIVIGKIRRNSATTVGLYTTSDYRYKTDVVNLTGGLERLMKIPVRRFRWKIDPNSEMVDGFLSHEVADIVPEAVSGVKDGIEIIKNINDEGKVVEQESIVPQGLDQSKLVPLLTAAIQELSLKLDAALKRIDVLENI
jgi:hypothetical protein